MHLKKIILILRFSKCDFQKGGEQITGYKFLKLLYIEMGLSESSLNIITKPFSFLSHCKVSCDSPCCTKVFGDENNHCICNIDTHEYINDSDEEHIETQ